MVALSPATPEVVFQDKDLRGRIGVGVAVAWVLTQLWMASPLPFVFWEAAGIDLHVGSAQFGWVHLTFAAAAAFLLFDGRLIRSCWANVLLAAAAGLIVSYPLWMSSLGLVRDLNMENLLRIPLPIDLVMTALGLFVFVLMAGRIFGRLGAALALLALIPPNFFTGLVEGPSFTTPALATELSDFLQEITYGKKGFGWIGVQFSAVFSFLFVAVGAGLDHIGLGRKVGAFSSKFLTRNGKRRVDPLTDSLANAIFRASFALVIVLHFSGEFQAVIIGGREAVILLGIGAGLYLVCYIATGFLDAAGEGASQKRSKVVRAALEATHFAALVVVATLLFFGLAGQVIAGLLWLLGRDGLLLGGFATPLFFIVAAILVTLLAFRSGSARAAGAFRAALAVLPLVTLNWFLIVEGLSPGLSAFYGVVMLLVCLLGWRFVCDGLEGRPAASVVRRYLGQDVAMFCASTARFMSGFALVAALHWLALGWFNFVGLPFI